MNAHLERNQCRYCQIDLVNIQLLMLPQLTNVENKQPPSSVMKCPVCGYSEISEPSLAENHRGYNKIAILDRQASAA